MLTFAFRSLLGSVLADVVMAPNVIAGGDGGIDVLVGRLALVACEGSDSAVIWRFDCERFV